VNAASARASKAPLTLVILTYNEEVNIAHTLENAQEWAGEIVIVDSFSTDGTLDICRKYTDKIYQHPFENQAKQFNWALDNVSLQYEWVLRLDSDETLTPELAEEITRVLPTLSRAVTGIYMKRRVYFMGRWMKHGDYYPMWFLRLFRIGKGRYEEITEEHIVLSEGTAIRVQHDFIDYNRKGLSFWTDKHAHWAIGEMLDVLSMMGEGTLPAGTVRATLFGSQEQRRRWLKTRLYARLPLFLRAFAIFFYRYVLRFGFLDGVEGLIFHFLQGCWYRFYVDAKIYEAKRFGIAKAELALAYSSSKPWEAGRHEGAPKG